MPLFDSDDGGSKPLFGNLEDDPLFEMRYPEEDDEEGEPEIHVPADALREAIATASSEGEALSDTVEERSVKVRAELDEDAFFSTVEGHTTVTNRYDLERAVPMEKKTHFVEKERYWVNKPYAFVTIFHSEKENETKYYLIEPHLTPIEEDLRQFLTEKLRTAIKYQSDDVLVGDGADRGAVIEREMRKLLDRYDLYESSDPGFLATLRAKLGLEDPSTNGEGEEVSPLASGANADEEQAGSTTADEEEPGGLFGSSGGSSDDDPGGLFGSSGGGLFGSSSGEGGGGDDGEGEDGSWLLDATQIFASKEESAPATDRGERSGPIDGIAARPEPVLLEEDAKTLNEYQIEKLLYILKRDFVGFERIDGIKHDINVEDVSCDGYDSPVFVYHTDYEQLISNVYHGREELDEFVVKLAQRSGKGISKRQPQVDATLPDGSRAQLTLGREVSDHGTNYTIRQFKDVPFTPLDLINWRTFSLDQMAFLWLAIENHKSLIFAGGTASGKTTSLNAVSLFIPSNAKIVSIEDTREVELPQRNWIASVTRPSFSEDSAGDIDEFDLLEAALRQRPDYIVMGEIRGEEGRTLFQVMSTGHTTYTTFHADSVGEVLKRFTTEPINVSKTLFTALDLVSIQTQTRVQGRKVRKSKSITEINEYNAENDEINVQDVYQWRAETDEFDQVGRSNVLEQIMFDRGWDREKLEEELFKRRTVIAYLIRNGLNEYAQVAATIQAFISDPDTILALMANGVLRESLEDLRSMESVQIDIDPEKEELVPRPDPGEEVYDLTGRILDEAEDRLFEQYHGEEPSVVAVERALASAGEGERDVPLGEREPADADPDDPDDTSGEAETEPSTGTSGAAEDIFGDEEMPVEEDGPTEAPDDDVGDSLDDVVADAMGGDAGDGLSFDDDGDERAADDGGDEPDAFAFDDEADDDVAVEGRGRDERSTGRPEDGSGEDDEFDAGNLFGSGDGAATDGAGPPDAEDDPLSGLEEAFAEADDGGEDDATEGGGVE